MTALLSNSSGHLQVFLPSFVWPCLVDGWMFLVGEQTSPLLTCFWAVSRKGPHEPFLWYPSPLLLLLLSNTVNLSCSFGFLGIHLWTSGCITPEQTPCRVLKFLHLSRTGNTILSIHLGLSSTDLQNFCPKVMCPWCSLVIVLVLQFLWQQVRVWWLKGRGSQGIKTSGFSGVFFFLNVDKSAFLSLKISAWIPLMPVVTHDLYNRTEITSQEKNSTSDSSQASLGFLRRQSFLIMVYVTEIIIKP